MKSLLFGVMLLYIWISVGCQKVTPSGSRKSNHKPVSSSAGKVDSGKPVVYFGVISRYNPRIIFEEYQPIMDYLSRETDYRFELKLGKTYEDAVEFLCSGEVKIASLGGFTYLEAHERCGGVAIVKPRNKEGKPFYHNVFIVRRDSPVKSLLDLRGRSLAFASAHSTSGNLVPRYELAKAGINLSDLKHYQNLKHHDEVARAVIRGDFDAGALKDIIAYRYLEKGLRIIHISQPIPSVPLVVRADCDSELVTSVKKALLKINPEDPGQRKQMEAWNEEFRYGFLEATDADYEVLRKFKEELGLR